jgi:hypothetical protein
MRYCELRIGPSGKPEWYTGKRYYYEVVLRRALSEGGITAREIDGKRTPVYRGHKVNFVPN